MTEPPYELADPGQPGPKGPHDHPGRSDGGDAARTGPGALAPLGDMDAWTMVLRIAEHHGAALALVAYGLDDIPEGDQRQLLREAGDAYLVGATAKLIALREGREF